MRPAASQPASITAAAGGGGWAAAYLRGLVAPPSALGVAEEGCPHRFTDLLAVVVALQRPALFGSGMEA
jgi:hypothetical protein